MFKFGKNSSKNLSSCHKDLILIATETIKISNVDFGISEGHRFIDRQKELFDQGLSKIDGINKKGKHNYKPSLAFDYYIYHSDSKTREKIMYDTVHLSYVAGMMFAVAEKLFQEGRITHKIRWGADWDNDGIIDYDQRFDDYPHIELISI